MDESGANAQRLVAENLRLKKRQQKMLFQFCREGRAKAVDSLLSRDGEDVDVDVNVDVNSKDKDGRTALEMACNHGCLNVVRALLDHGADANAKDWFGNKALNPACTNGHVKVVKLLIERGGVDLLTARENYGMVATKWARMDHRYPVGRRGDCVKVKVESQTNADGWVALMEASRKGRTEIAELLIESGGVDVNERSARGCTALMDACLHGRDGIVGLLLRRGADPDVQEGVMYQTATMMAVMRNRVKCLETLLDWGPNLDLTDKLGRTVFAYAMKIKNSALLKRLLVEGKLLTDGKLRPVHKKARNYIYGELQPLLVTVNAGFFEWGWCILPCFKRVSLAALNAGFCPAQIKQSLTSIKKKYGPMHLSSPLIVALLENDTELIQTFTRHLYYFPEDYRTLSTNDDIRESITNKTVLDEITRRPLSLQTWSFLTVSKSISVSGPPGLRRQRVECLDIPALLKRQLQFKI